MLNTGPFLTLNMGIQTCTHSHIHNANEHNMNTNNANTQYKHTQYKHTQYKHTQYEHTILIILINRAH